MGKKSAHNGLGMPGPGAGAAGKHGKDVARRHEDDVDSDGDDREYANNQYRRYR